MHLPIARAAFFAAGLFCVAAAPQAMAAYPDKPIRWIVDAPAGGTSDTFARLLGKAFTEKWGQAVVVENRPGATSTIAYEAGARAAPDGYTLTAVANTLPLGIVTKPKLSYRMSDFAPVAVYFTAANAILVNANSKAKTLQDLFAIGRAKPGGLNYGTPGIGSAAHISAEVIRRRGGVEAVHIPFSGSAPVINELLADRIDFGMINVAAAAPIVQQGKARILAVTSGKRLAAMPDVPTVTESGLGAFDVVTWFGVVAPAGTPEVVLDMLNAEIVRQMDTPEFRQRITATGAEAMPYNVKQLRVFMDGEVERWGGIVRESGVTFDP